MEATQANFEGWAIVELFGHQREIGHVTTQIFGQACLFRIDVPEISEREYELTTNEWVGNKLVGPGSKVQRAAVEGRTRLIGPGAVYAINPCTEKAARQAIEKMFLPPLKLIEGTPATAQRALLGEREYEDDDNSPEDE